MRFKIFGILFISLIIGSLPAHAFDKSGYTVIMDYGCGDWVEHHQKSKKGFGVGLELAQATYLAGFMTAINLVKYGKSDWFESTNSKGVHLFVTNFCMANPLKSVPNAMEALMREIDK